MSERVYLTEQEKIKIIAMVYVDGHQWKMINEKIGHPYETVQSFYKSYLKHGTILPKQGRQIKIKWLKKWKKTQQTRFSMWQTSFLYHQHLSETYLIKIISNFSSKFQFVLYRQLM